MIGSARRATVLLIKIKKNVSISHLLQLLFSGRPAGAGAWQLKGLAPRRSGLPRSLARRACAAAAAAVRLSAAEQRRRLYPPRAQICGAPGPIHVRFISHFFENMIRSPITIVKILHMT